MRKYELNFLVDLAALVAMLGMSATGLILRFVLPKGSGGFRHPIEKSLWSMSRHEWGDLHFWLAVALAGLLLVHVVLHWSWVCGVVRQWLKRLGLRINFFENISNHWYGIGFMVILAVLLGGFFLLASANVVLQ